MLKLCASEEWQGQDHSAKKIQVAPSRMSLELPWTRSELSSEGVIVDDRAACDVAE